MIPNEVGNVFNKLCCRFSTLSRVTHLTGPSRSVLDDLARRYRDIRFSSAHSTRPRADRLHSIAALQCAKVRDVGSGLGRVRTRERLNRVEQSSLRRRLAKSGAPHGPAIDFAREQDSPPCTLHSSFRTAWVKDGRSGAAAATTTFLRLYTQQLTNVDGFDPFNVCAIEADTASASAEGRQKSWNGLERCSRASSSRLRLKPQR
jgi:hypothetical protein